MQEVAVPEVLYEEVIEVDERVVLRQNGCQLPRKDAQRIVTGGSHYRKMMQVKQFIQKINYFLGRSRVQTINRLSRNSRNECIFFLFMPVNIDVDQPLAKCQGSTVAVLQLHDQTCILTRNDLFGWCIMFICSLQVTVGNLKQFLVLDPKDDENMKTVAQVRRRIPMRNTRALVT